MKTLLTNLVTAAREVRRNKVGTEIVFNTGKLPAGKKGFMLPVTTCVSARW